MAILEQSVERAVECARRRAHPSRRAEVTGAGALPGEARGRRVEAERPGQVLDGEQHGGHGWQPRGHHVRLLAGRGTVRNGAAATQQQQLLLRPDIRTERDGR